MKAISTYMSKAHGLLLIQRDVKDVDFFAKSRRGCLAVLRFCFFCFRKHWTLFSYFVSNQNFKEGNWASLRSGISLT